MPIVPAVGSDTKPKSNCQGHHRVQEALAASQEFHNPDRPAVVRMGVNIQDPPERLVAQAAPTGVSVPPARRAAGRSGALV